MSKVSQTRNDLTSKATGLTQGNLASWAAPGQNSSQMPSPDPSVSSKASASSSTSNVVLTSQNDNTGPHMHSGLTSQTKYRNRDGDLSQGLPTRPARLPKNQQNIRNPAGQASTGVFQTSWPVQSMTNTWHSNDLSFAPSTLDAAEWKTWDGLRIRIFKLPPDTTAQNLASWFRTEGKVHFVEIYEGRGVDGTCNACLSFRPPPRRPFWKKSNYVLWAGDQRVATCYFGAPERSKLVLHASPVQRNLSYPETMFLKAESLDFGLALDENMILGMKEVKSTENTPIHLELNLKHKEIGVEFKLPILDWRAENLGAPAPRMGALNREDIFRFKIPFTDMTEIGENPFGRDCFALFVEPLVPPRFFKLVDDLQSNDGSRLWADQDAWYRQTDVVYNPNSLKRLPLSLKKRHPFLDLGRWTTYRFIFNRSKNDMGIYRKMHSALQDYNVKVAPYPNLQLTTDVRTPVWEYIDRSISQNGQGKGALQELAHDDQFLHISFRVRYQLEVCISLGCFNEYNLDRKFIQNLASMEPKSAQDLLEFVALEKKRIFKPLSIFDLKSVSGTTSSTKIPDYCVLVRSATITPTRVIFHTPSVDTSNRVIRQYSEYADRFLRVRFTDEQSESKIFSTKKETMNEVFTRIKRIFANGIRIGNRGYEFLGYGNSQLREHGAYFFAPTAHLDAKRIRMWMGSFQDIHTVAKYASRLGQCFSTTRAIKGVVPHIEELDDIYHNGFCFTDGVGRISPFLAQLAASELGIIQSNHTIPSVFQFRLGGCKGVLTVSPTSAARDLHLRLSQYKFPASHEGLEIIRWSQYACAKLNRQLILVLSTLGVADEIFKRKMKIQLQDLEESISDSKRALALLQKYVDNNQMTLTIASMIIDGFQQSEEPFMLALLHLWKSWSLKYLKEKAQIAVEGGALLLGCVDETNQLQGHYDDMHRRMPGPEASVEERLPYLPEIFVQLSQDPNRTGGSKPKIILGPVLLTRSPILHPGDVRVVHCIDVPELHHIKDAVVLPQNGDRDLASMCSGGDLDGDDFLVVWDRDLLPKEWNHTPMDYSGLPPLIHGREITVDDMTTFFVTYMKNDSLGAIATAHVAWADQSDQGVKDERCLRLAQLHSQAVDFAKTGQPAVMTPDLRPRSKPHFQMDKNKNGKQQCYRSGKILGQLYDLVEMSGFSPTVSGPFDARILEAFDVASVALIAARRLKREYDSAMRRIMAKYEIQTEFEVWSTFVLSHNWSNDFKFHEEIGQVSGALKCQFREECIKTAGGKHFEQLGIFVAAMYRVTAEDTTTFFTKCSQPQALNRLSIGSKKMESRIPLISFPWIFQDILGKIVQLKGTPSLPFNIPCASAELESEDSMQLKAQKSNQRKGRSLINPMGNVLELETLQGIVHPGDLFKPFTSQNMKDLEELGVEKIPYSDAIELPGRSSSASGSTELDEWQFLTAHLTTPPEARSPPKQSSSFEVATVATALEDLDLKEATEASECEDAEEVVIDRAMKSSASKLLEAFAQNATEQEEQVDDYY